MTGKRIFGIIVVVIGIALLVVSNYIKDQVEAGQEQIAGAQKNVNRANSLFSLSPATKDIGGTVTGGIQKNIAEGQEQVDYYEKMAGRLELGGWICIVVGAGFVYFGGRRKKS